MHRDFRPPDVSLVTQLRQLPNRAPISVNAWMCGCGAHGVTDSRSASRHQLESHLARAGHGGGEYYYGRREQRTIVEVTADPDGRFTHRLV